MFKFGGSTPKSIESWALPPRPWHKAEGMSKDPTPQVLIRGLAIPSRLHWGLCKSHLSKVAPSLHVRCWGLFPIGETFLLEPRLDGASVEMAAVFGPLLLVAFFLLLFEEIQMLLPLAQLGNLLST